MEEQAPPLEEMEPPPPVHSMPPPPAMRKASTPIAPGRRGQPVLNREPSVGTDRYEDIIVEARCELNLLLFYFE